MTGKGKTRYSQEDLIEAGLRVVHAETGKHEKNAPMAMAIRGSGTRDADSIKKDYPGIHLMYPVKRVNSGFLLGHGEAGDLEEGNLLLSVNVAMPRRDLLKEFERWIRIYEKFVKKRPKKKSPTLDHWEIYNMVRIEGLSAEAAAKKKSGIKGNSSIDKELMRVRRQVERALKHADQVIAYVKETKYVEKHFIGY